MRDVFHQLTSQYYHMITLLATTGAFLIKAILFCAIAGLGAYVPYFIMKQLIAGKKEPSTATMLTFIFFMFMASAMLFSFVSPESESSEPIIEKVSASSSERVLALEKELRAQQEIYRRYAPLAQQARIAERNMTLANQRANIIREELKLLQGFQEGAK